MNVKTMLVITERGSGVSVLDRLLDLHEEKLVVVHDHIDTPEEIATANAERDTEFLAFCSQVEVALRNEFGYSDESAKQTVVKNTERLSELFDEDISPQGVASKIDFEDDA